ncbi:uncharacterized protein [Dermacentor albipictus]
MVLTSAAINQVAAFAQYGVTSLVALAVSGMGDEDVYDDWSVFDAEMSQPSFIEPPTPSTNATCPALEDGLSGQDAAFKSLLVKLAVRERFIIAADRAGECESGDGPQKPLCSQLRAPPAAGHVTPLMARQAGPVPCCRPIYFFLIGYFVLPFACFLSTCLLHLHRRRPVASFDVETMQIPCC